MKNFKQVCSMIMVVALIISGSTLMPLQIKAANLVSGNYEYVLNGEGTAEIVKYNGKEKTVTIPSSLGSKKVTGICPEAFKNNSTLQTLTIPEGITKLDWNCFYNCSALTKVNYNAIKCDGNATRIFRDCDNLTTVTIGNKVETIGGSLFQDLPIKSVTIPKSVTSIGYNAFRGTSLKSVTIPENITELKFSAFEDCKSLETVYYNAVKCDGAAIPVFRGCDKLNKVIIGSKVTIIGTCLFQETPITSIVIPAKVTDIRYNAFKNCSKLKSISLPEGLKSISFSVFEYCDSLTDVYYGGTKESWTKIQVGDSNENLIKAKIHFGKILVTPSKITKATKKKAKTMKVSIKKVGGSAGYIVQVSASKKFKKVLVEKTMTKTSFTVSSKKIKGKKTLFVRVRNTQNYNGKLFLSKWSKATKVKVK